MTPENFNLQIQTPETGDNDEISKLKAELMAIKPLLDDAIKRQSLKQAEELFAKAKELKEKLNQLRNKEKGIYTKEINGQQMELGPDIGKMNWDEIPEKLEELNKTLKPGEKPWRVPTKEEFEEIGRPIREVWSDQSLSVDQKTEKTKQIVKNLGFDQYSIYWSSSKSLFFDEYAWLWESNSGKLNSFSKDDNRHVRLIR